MKYAIVEISGKQLWIEPFKKYKIDFLNLTNYKNSRILLKRILILKTFNSFKIGTPYLNKLAVQAKVFKDIKDIKLLIYKMKSKKKVRKKQGHRQKFNKIKIEQFVKY